MATLTTTTLDVASGRVTCTVELTVQGNNTPIQINLQSADILAAATAAGRTDWNMSDVAGLCQAATEFPVVLATPAS